MKNKESKDPILYAYFKNMAEFFLKHHELSSQQNASNNLGTNRELFCSEFLEKVLPPKLTIKSGEIWDSSNNKTGQLDLIILRDDAPALKFGPNNSADAYLAEGVFAVIEVKSNLSSDKLTEAGNGLLKVKKLDMDPGISISCGAVLSKPLRIVFAYKGATWKSLINKINQNNWQKLFDIICVVNRGALVRNGLLLAPQEDTEWLLFDDKAASLGWLYFHLVTFATSFTARNINLDKYFEPFEKWNSSKILM